MGTIMGFHLKFLIHHHHHHSAAIRDDLQSICKILN